MGFIHGIAVKDQTIARRTNHPFDDLRQLAMIGLLKAALRFDGKGGRQFRPYGRTFANGEITHYLRDHGYAIKVPPTWRDLYASGQKLLRQGVEAAEVPGRLGIWAERWRRFAGPAVCGWWGLISGRHNDVKF